MRPRAFFLALLALLLLTVPAFAAGTFKLKSTELTEVSGAWHVWVTIELPKEPSTAHQTMRFVFTKTAVYERALVDGKSEPVINRQALKGQTPSVESQDVDFANASGKIFKGTRFDFGLTRQRGFESGEYTMELRTSDGVAVGSAVPIVLKGDNPVVDRRAIAFNAKDSSIKKVAAHDAGAKVAGNDVEEPSANSGMGTVTATGSAQPFIPADAYNKVPEEDIKVQPKSGCGCTVPGVRSEGLLFAMGPIALVGLALLRRRRSAR